MRQLVGQLLPGETMAGAAPAAPGLIRRRSRPPLLVPAGRLFSTASDGSPGFGGRAVVSENGTPNVQIGNVFATNFPNPFFRGESGISASAARYASGTNSDGSTRYSNEVAYLRLWLPRQGVTAFDFAITSRNTTLTSPATYYAGFRNSQPNTRAFLGAFTVEREAAATYYSKEFAVRQDGVEGGLDYRTGPDEFAPSLYLQALGASQGYTDFFFLHYLRIYFD